MTYEDVKRIRNNPTSEDVDNGELQTLIDLAIDLAIKKQNAGCSDADDIREWLESEVEK